MRHSHDLLTYPVPRLAILGLTYQYLTSRITREDYEAYHNLYNDEVFRLNPLPPEASGGSGFLLSLSPDDVSVRATQELRFMFFRHWTLYDAMYHSSYAASKLGIWKERGRKRLTGLLAKMGWVQMCTHQHS
jgi:cell division control protein 45